MAKEICCKQRKIRFFFWRLKRPKLARIVSGRLETSLALMTYLAVSSGERVTFISLLHNILVKNSHFARKNNGYNALYSLKLTYSDKVSHKLSCKEETFSLHIHLKGAFLWGNPHQDQ